MVMHVSRPCPNEIYRGLDGTLIMIQEGSVYVYNEMAFVWVHATIVSPNSIRESYQMIGRNLKVKLWQGGKQ